MPREQIVSPRIGKPSGHFSQANAVEARGRRAFFSDPPLASTMVAISGITHPDYLIETNAIAIIPG